MERQVLVWRSLLYVPANIQRFIDKAHTRGADALILDLEDSVPMAEKVSAREMLPDSIKSVRRSGADVLVRINRPLRMALADLEAAIRAGADAIWVSTMESPEHAQLLSEVAREVEHECHRTLGSTKFAAIIENPAAFFRAAEIARADPRIVAMGLGSEDFALETGMTPDSETLYLPKQTVQFAARSAGIMPLGFFGTVADFTDTDGFTATVRRSRRFGFEGAAVVHPSGVPILNAELTPTDDEVAYARKLMAAYEEAESNGIGAITVDGKMVDVPIVERARRLLTRAKAIATKDHRKAEFTGKN